MTDDSYRWRIVSVLALTETISYGVLTYAFPVFLAPMEAELGWSRTTLTGAFSLALLVSGLAAIPAGRWVDRYGPRGLMAAGSCAAALLLVAWSRVGSVGAFYVIWIGLGLAMAAVLYEPAFATVAAWFTRDRTRALTLLTFVAGFASIIFIPLAGWLVEQEGWRRSLVALAVIVALGTAVPHALVLRRAPNEAVARVPHPSSARAVRSPAFRAIAASFALGTFASMAVFVHLIPFLTARGHTAAYAAAATGLVGVMALPGRLIFTPLGAVWPRATVAACLFFMQAVALAVLAFWPSTAGVWIFIVLFGAGSGAVTPARAALVADVFGAAHYGSIAGGIAAGIALARAAAPAGASIVQRFGGYGLVFALLAAVTAGAGATVLAVNRRATPAV